jgi:hypothetical protein
MDVLVDRAAGLDFRQAAIVARDLVGRSGVRPANEIRGSGTMAANLVRSGGLGRAC